MKTLIKQIAGRTYKPLLAKYLSKTRIYRYGDIRLQIPPEVFHPGFFFSTRLLLRYILSLSLKDQCFLELGAGSGLISMYAAKSGAIVTATDINPVATDFLHKNSKQNNVNARIILSDLFDSIPLQQFDIIAINPPFYKKNPRRAADHAWYCGENGEYFEHLFRQLYRFIHQNSHVLMVLSEECDIAMISSIALSHHFHLQKKITKKSAWEYLYIYQISPVQ